MVADVDGDGARETARLIEQDGGRALAVSCDVTDSDQIQAALAATIERFARLDIAFNTQASSNRSRPRTRSPTRSGIASSRSTCAARSSP